MNISPKELKEKVKDWNEKINNIIERGDTEISSNMKEYFSNDMKEAIIRLSSPNGRVVTKPKMEFLRETLQRLRNVAKFIKENPDMDYRSVQNVVMELMRISEGWKSFI